MLYRQCDGDVIYALTYLTILPLIVLEDDSTLQLYLTAMTGQTKKIEKLSIEIYLKCTEKKPNDNILYMKKGDF